MTKIRLGIGLGLLVGLASVAVLLVGAAGASHSDPGFKTAKPAYLVGTAPGVVVDPILSTGDVVGDPATGYQMSGIPDGLGAYDPKARDKDDDHRQGEFVTVMNHELGRSFPNNPPDVDARISRLEIDPETRTVHKAEYLFEGNEGFERFCSATLAIVFGRPYYFTGEEAVPIPGQLPGPAHDGSSIVMDPDSGMWRETPHFGHLQHENIVPVKLRKWVFLTTEDDFRVDDAVNDRQDSYLYAYIADDFNEALRGTSGSLYVWKSNDPANNQNSAATKGESIPGHFEPIPQSLNTDSTALKNAAAARGAFKFDRLEDLTSRPDVKGRMYFAETGKPPTTMKGRIYQLDLDPRNPTQGRLKMILNGDAPDNDDIINPDNMAASEKVLVIQEDRESAFRGVVGGTTDFSRVLVYDFKTESLTPVARVATPATLRPGTWESSGVIDAGHVLGKNWWLLDVQAHSTTAPQPGPSLAPNSSSGEDGQLLALKIPKSQGDRHDDDD
jgi:Bacterial protein of unknown function (DUF839)